MIDIKVPEAGESISQVELAKWLAEDGDYVEKDQEIAEIDSDKATLTINADDSGVLKIMVEEGTTIEPGKIIGQIDNSVKKEKKVPSEEEPAKEEETEKGKEESSEAATEEKKPADTDTGKPRDAKQAESDITISPQARKLLDELNIDLAAVTENPNSSRITRKDILAAIAGRAHLGGNQESAEEPATHTTWSGSREVEKVKMTTLRKKVAERLVAVKNETAMLTTFNEVDMSAIIALRNKYKDQFLEKHGIKPGFMSFFVKAVTLSIPFFPQVNGQIEDGHILLPDYADIGIAVSTPKGLMVPVIRDAQKLSLAQLEKEINLLAQKARNNKITLEDLTGGTFSITNGGVFGSMLSTPIINPPQSAILGMHNIVERPVAINGKVEIRPIMYVALSYDHRIIDGKESVGFLVKVKELLENPAAMLFPGKSAEELLLDI